jgi:predicted Zn-dependent peptidase
MKLVEINIPSFHTVTNFLVIRSGSRYETAQNNGIAHFLEHMVFKGTKSFSSSKEIAEAIEGVGGYFNAWTANDHTAYWNIVPHDQYQRGIKVACELAFTPRLNPEDLERERGVIIEEIRRMQDDPASLVDDLLGGVVFPNHSLGRSVIGSEETIKAMSIEQFRQYHHEHYAPSQAYFVCVGNLEGKDIKSALWEQIKDLKPKPVSQPELFTGDSRRAVKVLNKKTDQTHFMLATATSTFGLKSEDRFIGVVLNAILGRGMSSRLFLNIREKKGLAYAINSTFHSFEDTGLISVYGGVNTGKIAQALDALTEEFAKLINEEVGAEELEKAKAQLVGSYDLSADRPIDLATWYGTNALLGAKESFEEAKSLVRSVTAKQIQELASRVLSKENLAMAVVGPYPSDQPFVDFLSKS